jgi:Fe-S-cluster-containing dehydrogenase component/formate-dependent nitrite reductase membrane component NrfD
VQLGFVIDHSRCIGCHACTVACKAENDVPLGSFRTWVKYTELGTFPEVKRSFAVLRCNQCTAAPCVAICPVRALEKRPDGVVDVDPAACIGCKACMQGCPYDALYLNDSTGTAQKCHFCVHRTELGLAPACAVVCPTEAIIPGDFHDPVSVVSKMRIEHDLRARKVEAGTGPNVFYREVGEAGIDPALTHAAGGYMWANRLPGVDLASQEVLAARDAAETRARTTYDVDHAARWGRKVSAYLFTKSVSAGAFLMVAVLLASLGTPAVSVVGLTVAAMVFLCLTTVLLVADLKRPERFLYILLRPNWDSWLARGGVVLAAYGVVLALTLVVQLATRGAGPLLALVVSAGAVLAALTAAYTGWLFAQARGRVLWMRRGLWLHLIVQALVAGAAFGLVGGPALGLSGVAAPMLRLALLVSVVLHAVFVLTEEHLAPRNRETEYARASMLVTRGPFALRHWALGVGAGVVAPALVLSISGSYVAGASAGLLALAGLWIEEDTLVRAGQSLPIS